MRARVAVAVAMGALWAGCGAGHVREAATLRGGSVDAGRALFLGKHGCVTCHGFPEFPGTNPIGPDLHGIAATAGDRVAGQSAAEYLLASLVDPDAYIAQAPVGPNGKVLERMPGVELDRGEASHLVAYLLSLRVGSDSPQTSLE